MYTNWVKVFHGTYCDGIAFGVTDDFEFDFFPAADALFDKDLMNWRCLQTVVCCGVEFFCIGANATAAAA